MILDFLLKLLLSYIWCPPFPHHLFVCLFVFFLKKDMNILLIKDHEHKAFTSQNIKLCKIVATCYEIT
jgi:hypothetical protein